IGHVYVLKEAWFGFDPAVAAFVVVLALLIALVETLIGRRLRRTEIEGVQTIEGLNLGRRQSEIIDIKNRTRIRRTHEKAEVIDLAPVDPVFGCVPLGIREHQRREIDLQRRYSRRCDRLPIETRGEVL